MLDVEAILRRIGLDAAPAPDTAGLFAVHRAYLEEMPYEALAIQLGEQAPLDVGAVAARVLDGGRGGYCFELNGLLAALLEALGFAVDRRTSVVGPRGEDGPINHLALIVSAEGARWVCDAGLGEGFVEPLPLIPGTYRRNPFEWTVEDDEQDGWWIAHHAWGSFPGYAIHPGTVGLEAFDEAHRRLSHDARSSFVQTLVLQRPFADRIVTLRARTLSIDGPDQGGRRLLADPGELADALREEFGVDSDRLGPERLARLWAAACAQHEAWAARQHLEPA